MEQADLKDRLQQERKQALRDRNQDKLRTLGLILAEIKQVEVDQQHTQLDETSLYELFDRMLKQRRDSIAKYREAQREDLVAAEQYEIDVIGEFLPEPLTDAEVEALITKTIQSEQAESMRDMQKVIAALRPQVLGRADMGKISAQVKQQLSGS